MVVDMITAIPEGWQPNRIVRDHERHGRYQISCVATRAFTVARFPCWPSDESDKCHVMPVGSPAFHENLPAALEAVQRDIARLDTCTANPCVHLLRHGYALCGLSGMPRYWPQGNTWAGIDEAHVASCEECKSVLARAQAEGLL